MQKTLPLSFAKGLVCLLAFGATFAEVRVATAQPRAPAPVDRRAQRPLVPTSPDADPGQKSPWRGSTLSFNNSATTETLGLGQDVQSENPTYEMSFGVAPRYYLWEAPGDLTRTLSVGARLELIGELTNSDTTTDRGEWTLSNLALGPQYWHELYGRDGYEMALSFRAPALSFPTSKASRSNGTILGLGTTLLATQELPLLSDDSPVLRSFGMNAFMGFEHVFRKTTTPTNPEIERERMGPDGVTVPNDQLTGRAFTQDEIALGFSVNLAIHERVRFTNLFEWHLGWKYRFQDDTEMDLLTGPAPVEHLENPEVFGVVALFASEIGVTVLKELDVEVGYQNLAPQLGPDAERRSMFYSPNARLFLTLVGHLDAIVDRVAGNRKSSAAAERMTSEGTY